MGINKTENIVYKTAVALNKFTGKNNKATIEIDKKIPSGAGLGGGSSDAATTLILLNDFWNLNLKLNNLVNIAAELGSDVPFFLYDKPAFVKGKGEIIETLNLNFNASYLIIYPNIHINTKMAYNLLDFYRKEEKYKQIETTINFHRNNSNNENIFVEEFGKYLENDFEAVMIKEYQELFDLKNYLAEISNGNSLMTGSGSTFFVLFNSFNEAKFAQTIFLKKYNSEKYNSTKYRNYATFIGNLCK